MQMLTTVSPNRVVQRSSMLLIQPKFRFEFVAQEHYIFRVRRVDNMLSHTLLDLVGEGFGRLGCDRLLNGFEKSIPGHINK